MAPPVVVAYSAAAVCFQSPIAVVQNHDVDDGGVRADLTFRYRGAPDDWSVPPDIGAQLAKTPAAMFEICAVPIALGAKATPMLDVIEISRGKRSIWHERYEFPVEQPLVYSDKGGLLVHLGHAMDAVYATPFHGVGDVEIEAPADFLRRKLPPQDGYRLTISIDEHEAGATIALVAIDLRDPHSGWQHVWHAPAPTR